jgi:hypothetical protein
MTDPLTPARFAELAEAYGGTIARWPEAVRADAIRLAADPALRALLEEQDRLDARLDLWRIEAPDPALRQRIAARRPIAFSRRARLWWSGLGIATALAGATAGSIAAAAAVPAASAVAGDETTVFGNDVVQEN